MQYPDPFRTQHPLNYCCCDHIVPICCGGLLKPSSSGKILKMPCCYDGLTAKLVESHAFPLTFMTGFGVSGARGK